MTDDIDTEASIRFHILGEQFLKTWGFIRDQVLKLQRREIKTLMPSGLHQPFLISLIKLRCWSPKTKALPSVLI